MARILSFRGKIAKHGTARGKRRYAIMVPLELSEKLEKEDWVGREVEVIVIEPDA
mgnify:CR=1 FL=1